ncbi:aldo/keto reductase, partial [Candidatus Latescibacterota bacterium]
NREQVLENTMLKIFDDARDKGYTRFVGFSTHKFDDEISEAALESKFWEAVLVPYNYISPPSVSESIKKVREAGLAVIGMKNLLNFNTRPRKSLEDIRENKNGPVTYAQAHLKWVLSNTYIDTIIPGVTSFEQLQENISIMGKKMSYEDHNILYRFSERIKGSHCFGLAGCTGCKGQCPKGVNVSDLNRCLGYAYGYGDRRLAEENYINLTRSNRIDRCNDCEECIVKCINGLNLTKNIQKARELFA